MRTLTYIKLIALGALLLAAGLVLREVRRQTDPENVRRSLLAALAGAVRGEVQIGSARFGLDGVVEAEQVAVTAPDAEEPLLQCERVAVQMDRGQILRGRKVVRSVRMEGLMVRLRRSPEKRRWNLADLQPPRPEGRARPAGPLPERITVQNATLLVEYPRLLRDAEPARYEGLYLEFAQDKAAAGSWSFDGSLRRGPLRGTRLRGHFAVGSPLRLLVEVQAESLEVGRELLRLIPFGDRVWTDYRPEGVIGVEGVVSTDTDGSLGYDFSVAVRDASFLTRFVGAPVEAASGTMLVSDRGVRVDELLGTARLAEPDAEADLPAFVRVEADHRWNGEGHYVIRATDLPLHRTILQAIPGRGEEIWRRLRPEGYGDLHLILDRRRGDAPMRYRAVANVHRATLRPEELPLPLSEVEGVVSVDGDSISLRDVRGLVRQTTEDGPPSVARVRVDGTVGTRSGALDLNVRVDNLRVDESALKAVEHAGGIVWNAAAPRGAGGRTGAPRAQQRRRCAAAQRAGEHRRGSRPAGVLARPAAGCVGNVAPRRGRAAPGGHGSHDGPRGSLPARTAPEPGAAERNSGPARRSGQALPFW